MTSFEQIEALHPINGFETKNFQALFHHTGGEFAEDETTSLFRSPFDSAIAEERIEFFSQFIEIIGKTIREQISRHQSQALPQTGENEGLKKFPMGVETAILLWEIT